MRIPRLLAIAIAAVVLATPAVAATSGERCAAAKMRAAARKAKGLVQCHVSAVDDGGSADAGCLAKVQQRFVTTWARIEARGGCVTTGDLDDIEAIVDAFVAFLTSMLPASTTTSFGPATTSTSSTTVTVTSSCPPLTAFYCGVGGCGPFPPPLCPPGLTCDLQTCTCVGPAIPCGDLHNPNFCRWGECPSGMTCGADPTSTSCPQSCACH
jgi:hypothetical protein